MKKFILLIILLFSNNFLKINLNSENQDIAILNLEDLGNLENENNSNKEISLKNLSTQGKITAGLTGTLLLTFGYVLYKNVVKYPIDILYYTYQLKNNNSELVDIKEAYKKLDEIFIKNNFTKSFNPNFALANDFAERNRTTNKIFSIEMPIKNINSAYIFSAINIGAIIFMLAKYGNQFLKKETKKERINKKK